MTALLDKCEDLGLSETDEAKQAFALKQRLEEEEEALEELKEDPESGVYVKDLVEGGKGALTGKIRNHDLLMTVNGVDVTKMVLKQVLEQIKASSRPLTLEFERPPQSAKAGAGDYHGNVYSTLFEKGSIGILFEDEPRPEEGGAVVQEIVEGSQAATHKPPVKVGELVLYKVLLI